MTVEVKELRDSARQVMAGVGAAAPEDKIWSLVIELGWLLVSVPEQQGGLAMGLPGACAIHSELGYGLSSAPYLPQMLAVDAVCASSLVDRDDWLERLMSGEQVATALAASDFHVVQTDAGEAVLSGLASAVQSADRADYLLIWTAQRDTVALIARDQVGVDVGEHATWDVTRRLFDVRLDNVKLSDQTLLASGAQAAALVDQLLSGRDFALAADAIGGANAVLDITVEHLQVRRQFGRPLAMFQALKHRCADMRAMITAAEALLADCLNRCDGRSDAPQSEQSAREAKYLASAAFFSVAEQALQLHGGIGMASEHPCHLFLKRALLAEHLGRGVDNYPQEIAEAFLRQQADS